MTIEYTTPLRVKPGFNATPQAQRGFNPSFPAALNVSDAVVYLEDEIRALEAENAIISSDCEQLAVDRLRKRVGQNPGVGLELRLPHGRYYFLSDRWQSLEHNLYALHLILRSYRLMEKHGVASMPQLMRGFSLGVPAPAVHPSARTNGSDEWRSLLGLGPTATLDDAEAVYRRRVKLVVEDAEAFTALNNAMNQARKALRMEHDV